MPECRCLILTAILGLGGACKTLEQTQSSPTALVSPEQAEKAFEIIKGIDYLPYHYKRDGCYARALYMSMELAAEAIPSSSLFLFGQLRPNADISWRYHVAPLLTIGLNAEPFILDPSLSEEGRLASSEWILRANPQGGFDTLLVPGSIYVSSTSDIGQGRAQYFSVPSPFALEAGQRQAMIATFAQLSPFHRKDIYHACRTMGLYLYREAQAAQSLAEEAENSFHARREKLLERTRYLIGRLMEHGKIDDSPSQEDDLVTECAEQTTLENVY